MEPSEASTMHPFFYELQVYKISLYCAGRMTLSKHITYYDPWLGFPGNNPNQEGTWGYSGKLCELIPGNRHEYLIHNSNMSNFQDKKKKKNNGTFFLINVFD